jgi:putative lipoic acid-binding regulatory protein
MSDNEDTLLEFPCRFPIKAMGKDEDEFVAHVLNLISPHFPEISENDISTRLSSGGRYISVTVTVTATSKLQLDAIYYALTDSERVLMAL